MNCSIRASYEVFGVRLDHNGPPADSHKTPSTQAWPGGPLPFTNINIQNVEVLTGSGRPWPEVVLAALRRAAVTHRFAKIAGLVVQTGSVGLARCFRDWKEMVHD